MGILRGILASFIQRGWMNMVTIQLTVSQIRGIPSRGPMDVRLG